MRIFKFAPPKGPGYGISQHFHLSVLAAKAQLPSILEIVNPKGDGGAVAGFGVPLAPGSTKEDLGHPLQRGAYGVASPDRKTVLQMVVISKEEAGFDPEAVVGSPMAQDLAEDLLARIRATWNLVQFVFRSHDAAVWPAMDFLSSVAKRVAEVTDGCIADPMSERYLLPGQAPKPSAGGVVQAADHVAVKAKPRESGLHVFTMGMRKFALPELELCGVEPSSRVAAETFLLEACQGALAGRLLQPGGRVGAKAVPFQVAEGGLDRGMWEGIAVYELVPPTGKSPADALSAWAQEEGRV